MNAMAIWLLAVLMSSSFVVIAYQVPGTSNSSLQVHRDGTLTFDVLFLNWTGFWVFPKVIPAGEFSVQKLFTVSVLMHMYIWFSYRCLYSSESTYS